MVTTAHLLSGAAIGMILKEPLLVVPAAYASHYMLDFIPHYAPKAIESFRVNGFRQLRWTELVAKGSEPLVGVSLVVFLLALANPGLRLPIALGAFCGWLPDSMLFLEWKYKLKLPGLLNFIERKIHHNPMHRHIKFSRGVWAELLVAIWCGLYLLINLNR